MATQQPEAACREVSLDAVRSDGHQLAEDLATIELTLDRLADHLTGGQVSADKNVGGVSGMPATSPGMLPGLCDLGGRNINAAQTIQEKLNQICYQLGEGR